MAFPNEPLIASPYAVPTVDPTVFPVPTWATSTTAPPGVAVKADPGADKRAVGWSKASPSVDYGEAPPFAWENHERYLNGQWSTYFKAVADYIKSGALAPSVAILAINTQKIIYAGTNDLMFFDTNNYYNYTGYPIWDPGPQHIVVPFGGLCTCYFNLEMTTPTNTSDLFGTIEVLKNGSVGIFDTLVTNTAAVRTTLQCSFSVVFPVTDGDALSIRIYNSSSIEFRYLDVQPVCTFSFSRTTPF